MKSGKPIAVFALICLFCTVAPAIDQWNLGQTGINAQAARENFGVDGNGVIIAFVGTGVNYTLPDLDEGYLGGYDFGDGDDDPIPTSNSGTQRASVAVGEGDSQIKGIAPKAKYYAVKVFTDGSSTATLEKIAQGTEWAINNGAEIVLQDYWSDTQDYFVQQYINQGYVKGMLFVGRSGDSASQLYPSKYNNLISVGGHTEAQDLIGSNATDDVVAPGNNILVLNRDGTTATDAGSDIAAAHVAGAIALMIDYNRQYSLGYSNSALWTTLNYGAVDLWPGDPNSGWGKADVNNALTLMANDWFIDVNSHFAEPNYYEDTLPGYFSSDRLDYAVTVTNNMPSGFTGHRDINNLKVTVSLRCDNCDANQPLDGNSVKVFDINLPADSNQQLFGYYDIPADINEGKIALDVKIAVADMSPEAAIRQLLGSSYAVIRIPCGQQVDFIADKIIDFRDLSYMAYWWLEDCNQENNWCEGADLDAGGLVDSNDLGSFVDSWLCRYP
ncbi:MAG: S8 family serine peptidase [Phycisphaerae bacterium]|jgi:hypothetical protein